MRALPFFLSLFLNKVFYYLKRRQTNQSTYKGDIMIRSNVFSVSIVLIFILSTILFGQPDTTVTITSEGNVGIGVSTPEAKLHVAGSAQFDKVGPEGRIILRSINKNDPGRMGIRFLNNQIAPFEGEDMGDMTFAFFSAWGAARKFDASLEIHGKAENNWGKYLKLSHNGTDGYVGTDAGNLILDPATGNGKIGVGLNDPDTKLDVAGIVRAKGNAWPGKGKGMELAYSPAQHRGFIQVVDRDDNHKWGTLYLGDGSVGIGTMTPASKLTVTGTIQSSSGGFKFPDGTVQVTAASGAGGNGLWKQVEVNALMVSNYSDKVSIKITPPSSDGYFFLTFSGMCSNLKASNKTLCSVYLNNVAGSGTSYPGYISYYQDDAAGNTRTIPMHTSRIFANSTTAEKTFYLYGGDLFDGGYSLYGMFTVQWFPGSQQK
jgi:hypothetical protein